MPPAMDAHVANSIGTNCVMLLATYIVYFLVKHFTLCDLEYSHVAYSARMSKTAMSNMMYYACWYVHKSNHQIDL